MEFDALDSYKDMPEHQLRAVLLMISKREPDAIDTVLEVVSSNREFMGRKSSKNEMDEKAESKMKVTKDAITFNMHTFKVKSYYKPTFCAVCDHLLVGLFRQGQECSACQTNVHRRCIERLAICTPRTSSASSLARSPSTDAEVDNEPNMDDDGLPVRSRASLAQVAEWVDDEDLPKDKRSGARVRSRTFGGTDSGDGDDDDGEVDANDPLRLRQLGRASKRQFRTGAAVDWLSHTKSFKERLLNSKKRDVTSMKIFLDNRKDIRAEYEKVPENAVNRAHMPRLTEIKNRFRDILPNNHSRVILLDGAGNPTNSYINANFMRGLDDDPDVYIAAQGPMDVTIEDFWKMTWQCKVLSIVMLTNLIEGTERKCERYWPETRDTPMVVGPFTITLLDEQKPCEQYDVIRLQVQRDGETRHVNHFWWRHWPDKGVPQSSQGLYRYIMDVRQSNGDSTAPTLVHCSAGIGRTGCYIAIDVGIREFDKYGVVDCLSRLCKLRQDRGKTVQTLEQYEFINAVLYKYMTRQLEDCPGYTDPADSAPPAEIEPEKPASASIRSHRHSVKFAESPAALDTPSEAQPSTRTASYISFTESAPVDARTDDDIEPTASQSTLQPQPKLVHVHMPSSSTSDTTPRPSVDSLDGYGFSFDPSLSPTEASIPEEPLAVVDSEIHALTVQTVAANPTSEKSTILDSSGPSVSRPTPTDGISNLEPHTPVDVGTSSLKAPVAVQTPAIQSNISAPEVKPSLPVPTITLQVPEAATTQPEPNSLEPKLRPPTTSLVPSAAASQQKPKPSPAPRRKLNIIEQDRASTVSPTPSVELSPTESDQLSPRPSPTPRLRVNSASVAIGNDGCSSPTPLHGLRRRSDPVPIKSISIHSHEFQMRTYVRDTTCAVCQTILEGVANQGLRCRYCRQDVHEACLNNTTECTGAPSNPSIRLPKWPPPQSD